MFYLCGLQTLMRLIFVIFPGQMTKVTNKGFQMKTSLKTTFIMMEAFLFKKFLFLSLYLFLRNINSTKHTNITIKDLVEEKKTLPKKWREIDGENCDQWEDLHHDKNWVAKNISDLMTHLLERYDSRIRPYFESKIKNIPI